MSQTSCHIDVAFYNLASMPTQCALSLSEHPPFLGPGWGNLPTDSVNGGVGISGHRDRVPMSINKLKTMISESNQASAEDRTYVWGMEDIPRGSNKYASLQDAYSYCRLSTLGLDSLAQFIKGHIRDCFARAVPQGVSCTTSSHWRAKISLLVTQGAERSHTFLTLLVPT
ncbi:hypothetical protein EI94DRAFT_1706794 [Lactarius quietus]|nr:hypothetical protein EI94DRAFT_1706794 [Lactarius quietus]